MMPDSFPDSFHAVVSLVLTCLFLNTGFVTWINTFNQLILVVLGVMLTQSEAPGRVISLFYFS